VSPCRSLCVKLSEFNLFDYFTFFNNSSYNFMDVMHDVWSEETLKNRHCVFCYTALLYTVQSSRKCSGVVCDVNDQYAVGLYLLICTFIWKRKERPYLSPSVKTHSSVESAQDIIFRRRRDGGGIQRRTLGCVADVTLASCGYETKRRQTAPDDEGSACPLPSAPRASLAACAAGRMMEPW